ncbi:hypothetical protein D3C87_1332100 [compost metagenome]
MQADPQAYPHQHGRQVTRHRQPQSGPEQQHRQGGHPHQGITPLPAGQGMGQRLHLADIGFRHLGNVQAEEVLDLQGGDHDGDAAGETQGHRGWNVFDEATEARHPHGHQEEAGDEGCHQQAPHPELLGHRIEDHHEGGGRPRDGETRAPRHGDDDAGDDGGVEAVLGRHPAGDGQRHGERNGDDADRDAGDEVAAEARHAIGFIDAGLAQCDSQLHAL